MGALPPSMRTDPLVPPTLLVARTRGLQMSRLVELGSSHVRCVIDRATRRAALVD